MIWLWCRFFFWITGWRYVKEHAVESRRAVVIAVPHTSNWDFFYMRAGFKLLRLPMRFTIKREWMRFPFNLFLRPMGAIAVNREPRIPGEERRSLVDAMADLFDEKKELAMVVTPEGTRSKVTKWKTGFYAVAHKAGVPIALGYLDYKKKEAGIGKVVYPSGDFVKDMKEILAFYAKVAPRHPEKFTTEIELKQKTP